MRPEELIAEIYRQIQIIRENGREPDQVIMSLEHFRLLEWYKSFLGEAEEGKGEYLGEYQIFGLEILIERLPEPLVK